MQGIEQPPTGPRGIAWGLVLRWLGLSVLLSALVSLLATALGLGSPGIGVPVFIVLATGAYFTRRRRQ